MAGMAALVTAALFLTMSRAQGQLQVGFYSTTCPNAEAIVRQAVTAAFANDPGVIAGLIQLHFHDCFVEVHVCEFVVRSTCRMGSRYILHNS